MLDLCLNRSMDTMNYLSTLHFQLFHNFSRLLMLIITQ